MIYSKDKTVLRVLSYKKCDNRKSEKWYSYASER